MTIAERNAKWWPDAGIPDSIREEIQAWAKETCIQGKYGYVEYPGASEQGIWDIRENCGSMFASRTSYAPLLEKEHN